MAVDIFGAGLSQRQGLSQKLIVTLGREEGRGKRE